MYSQKLLLEFYNPSHVGVIKGATGKGKTVSKIDGGIMKIYLLVEKNVIKDVAFQAFGSVPAIALCSAASRLILGKGIEDASKITSKEVLSELGGTLPSNKKHVASQLDETLVAALKSVSK